jgi:hypothetical protein
VNLNLGPVARDKLGALLVILGGGTSTATVVLGAIFQGLLLPQNQGGGDLLPEVINRGPWGLIIFYLAILGISVLTSVVVGDLERSILVFFASYAFAALLTFFVLALPGFVGAFQIPNFTLFLASNFTFEAFFPILLFLQLLGTLLGAALGERLP